MWRLRTSRDGGFAERGAAQSLAAWMGEEIQCAPQQLRHGKTGNIHSFKSPDGSVAVLRFRPFSLAFFSANGKKTVEIDNIAFDDGRSVLGGRLLTKEAVYGLGQRLDRLNKRGQKCVLYSSDGYNDSNSTYMPIPLFMTTRGGGVFVNAAERMCADFGVARQDAWLFEIERKTLDAYVIATDREKKMDQLLYLLDADVYQRMMIFCNTKFMTDKLTSRLKKEGYAVECIHGDVKQSQRNVVMNDFRKGKFPILIATDVAARGIDVDDVEAVINYDLPNENEYYLHRIGRTGRAHKYGVSFSLVTFQESVRMDEILKYMIAKPLPLHFDESDVLRNEDGAAFFNHI